MLQLSKLLFAGVIMIPMPIAGGIPFIVATTSALTLITVIMFGSRRIRFPTHGRKLFVILLALLLWEGFTVVLHNSDRDLNLFMARMLWIILGFSYISLLCGTNFKQSYTALKTIFIISLLFLSVAMFAESMFYPTYEKGRQLGAIDVPWPRATGVPQSDGKIGVFISLTLVFFVVSFSGFKDKYSLLGIILSIVPFLFTQSRSTLAALLLVSGFLYLHIMLKSSSTKFGLLLAFLGFAILVYLGVNFESIYQNIRGEGKFATNFDFRGIGVIDSMGKIADAPIFGLGGDFIAVEGFGNIGVHSTFMGLAVKSGLLAPILFILFLFAAAYPVLGVKGSGVEKLALYAAVLAGPIAEHNLYPGYFNEHLWLILPVSLSILYIKGNEPNSVNEKRTKNRSKRKT